MTIPARAQTPPKDSTKTQVIKDAAVYIPSTYVAQFCGLINAFVIRHLLGPTMMGIWATLQLILNYGGYLNLGSMQAGAKEIPFQMGRKDQAKADRITNNIFTFSLLMSGIGAALLVAGAVIFSRDFDMRFRAGLVAIGIILIGQRVYNFTVMLLRGYKNFALLAKLTVVTAVLDVSLAAGLIWLFGIYGLYASVISSMALSMAWAWRRFPYSVRLELDREVLREISKIGLPMLALGVVFTLLRTMDKILVVKYMGATELGIYSIALMASNYVFGLSNIIGVLTLPHFSENFGDKGDVKVLGGYMDQTNHVMGVLLPVGLGFLYFLAPLLIRAFLGAYTSGIPAMQVLLMGTYFLCLVHQPNNFLLATGQQSKILLPTIAGVAISAALNFWIVKGPRDLTLVAAATSFSYLATYLILLVTVERVVQRNASLLVPLAVALLPFAYVCAVLAAMEFAFRGMTAWWALPAKFFLFSAASAYPVLRMDKKTHVMRKAWGLFWEKVRSVRAVRRKPA